jgi:hypothetical protein
VVVGRGGHFSLGPFFLPIGCGKLCVFGFVRTVFCIKKLDFTKSTHGVFLEEKKGKNENSHHKLHKNEKQKEKKKEVGNVFVVWDQKKLHF